MIAGRMICHNSEKGMDQVLHCFTLLYNTSFNCRLNRKCKVQPMISLDKHRDIQLVQDHLIFIVWFSNKVL